MQLDIRIHAWTAVAVLAAGSPAAAKAGVELAPVLASRASDEMVPVVITFAGRADLEAIAAIPGSRSQRRAALIRALQARAAAIQQGARRLLAHNGLEATTLWIMNGLAVSAPAAVLEELARLPEVEAMTVDSTLAAPAPSGTSGAAELGPQAVRAPDLWARGITGAGTVVASMDTGVDALHPDLAASWRGGGNSWFDPAGEHPQPYDANGHGTQTMGLLVGGSAGGSAIGVAPDAQWIAVKLYNDAGLSTLSTIHQGFQWLMDPDGDPASDDAPDLVNNSWGFSDRVNECFTDFEPDIAALRAADILVLFSAGNLGPASLTSISPANNDGPLAVGALNPDLSIADFSSRGPAACVGDIYPELVAPGVNLRTSDLTLGGVVTDPYVSATGTSFSAPLVSGVAALLRSAQPAASVPDLELALTDSAVDLGPAGADDAYGLGLVDAVAAEGLLATIVGQPPAPVCIDADGDGYPAGADCTSAELDCADQDATIHPGACDIKRDGIDQDCDGSDRTSGKACPSSSGTADTASEGGKKGCSDGVDNDADGLTDCADPDCSSTRWCA